MTYARPFDLVDIPEAHFVGLADYVTVEDGTGLVHQAPAFGADDLAVARRYGLPVVNPIEPDGHFSADLPLVGGKFFKAADPDIVADLRERGLLLRSEDYTHAYPHCWRCDTPLIYYALPSWYIRTTAVKQALLRENAATDWHPPTIKTGRYGDWLENNIDWALSRNRYWGTPLPIWRCENDHLTVVESLAELSSYAGTDLSALDPHRPFVDDITFGCSTCGETAQRVPEVIDCWYDAGSMPFAQWGAPHRHQADFEASYPADYICEAIDQTRGWFYTLMAIGTLVFDASSYRTVLCLGHILDEQGRKMSKHLGNVLDPFELFERHGADAVRWFMLTAGNPWSARRVGHESVGEVVRKVLLTYWNTASFLVLYARANSWTPDLPAPAPAERPALDRWARSELHRTVVEVTEALEDFDPTRAGRRLTELVDDLSNWYVRRSRRRFWEGDPAALATLHECLDVVTKLLAPFIPFLTEEVHERLARDVDPDAADSVHLEAWPVADPAAVNGDLTWQMAAIRRLVELGRSARVESKVKTRQPLAKALVSTPGWDAIPEDLRAHLREELNVREVDDVGSEGLVVRSHKANYRSLGKKFGQRTPSIAKAIESGPPTAVAGKPDTFEVSVPDTGERVEIDAEDFTVVDRPTEGWTIASSGSDTIALDLELTDDLRADGMVRELIRGIQEARKSSGLEVTDRIELWWQADEPAATAVRDGAELLAREVLAVTLDEGAPAAPLAEHSLADPAIRFWLREAGT